MSPGPIVQCNNDLAISQPTVFNTSHQGVSYQEPILGHIILDPEAELLVVVRCPRCGNVVQENELWIVSFD